MIRWGAGTSEQALHDAVLAVSVLEGHGVIPAAYAESSNILDGCVISESCSCWQFSEEVSLLVALQEIHDSGGEPHFLLRVVHGYLYSAVAYGELWIVESRVLEKIASILGFIDIHLHIIGVTNGYTESPWYRTVGVWCRSKSPPCFLHVTSQSRLIQIPHSSTNSSFWLSHISIITGLKQFLIDVQVSRIWQGWLLAASFVYLFCSRGTNSTQFPGLLNSSYRLFKFRLKTV